MKATSSVVYLKEKISFSMFSLFLSLLCVPALPSASAVRYIYIYREQKQLPQDHFSVINVKQSKPPTPSSTGMSRICWRERWSSIHPSCFLENSSTKGSSHLTSDSAAERIDDCTSSSRRHMAQTRVSRCLVTHVMIQMQKVQDKGR